MPAPETAQPGNDWRELVPTRLARLAVARLRRGLAAGSDPDLPSGPELAALVEEPSRRRRGRSGPASA